MTNTKQPTTTALAVSPNRDEWETLQRQCIAFIDSGFLPDHITREGTGKQAVAKALTIAWKGRELGIPPLQAFSSITVIKGKPCLSSELMLALIYQRVPGAKVTFRTPPDKQKTECTVEMQRPGGDAMQFRFTIEDAKTAKVEFVSQKGQPTAWTKYPAAMLRARAISAGARAVFPDAILGCYTPEELGGEVIEAEVIEETPAAAVAAAINSPPAAPAPKAEPSPSSAPTNSMPPKGGASSGAPSRPTPPAKPPKQANWVKAPAGWQNDPCSEAQVKRLRAMGTEAGWDDTQLKDHAYRTWSVEHLADLTKGQIQEFFKLIEDDIQADRADMDYQGP